MNAKEKAAAVSDRHLQLQNELADARAETAALNEQLASAREVLALQRTPQPQSQLLVLADSSKLNAFTSDKISASITAVQTNANATEALLLSSAAARTLVAEAITQRALDAEPEQLRSAAAGSASGRDALQLAPDLSDVAYEAAADSAIIKEDAVVNNNSTKNALSERNVQAENSNTSVNNAANSTTATNELNELRAALQRMQQALSKAEQEFEFKF